MRLETAQVLALLGLTKETLRHWKKVLAPLAGRDGRSDGYSFDELIALALIARAVRDLQVPISRLAPVADRLFREVAAHVEALHTTTVLCISEGDVALCPIERLPSDSCLALVRLAPIVQDLRQRLAPDTRLDPQLSFDLSAAPSSGDGSPQPLSPLGPKAALPPTSSQAEPTAARQLSPPGANPRKSSQKKSRSAA